MTTYSNVNGGIVDGKERSDVLLIWSCEEGPKGSVDNGGTDEQVRAHAKRSTGCRDEGKGWGKASCRAVYLIKCEIDTVGSEMRRSGTAV
jgi:hypothetical protein